MAHVAEVILGGRGSRGLLKVGASMLGLEQGGNGAGHLGQGGRLHSLGLRAPSAPHLTPRLLYSPLVNLEPGIQAANTLPKGPMGPPLGQK